MAEEQSWERFLDEVTDALEPYSTHTYRWPTAAVVSASSWPDGDQSGRSIVLTDLGDGSVKVETGWSFHLAATYDIEEEGELSQGTQIVLGICSGQAEEYAIIDADGTWIGVGLRIRSQRGSIGNAPDESRTEAVHKLKAWPLIAAESGDGVSSP